MSAQPFRIACIGAGFFSQFHIDGWKRIEGAELVGITNRERSKAEATGLDVYDSLEEMLEHAKPDVIDIITSPAAHAESIKLALKYPVKAIICQKPFCNSIEEAREIVELGKTAGIPIIVHENFRFMPWYRAIKNCIDEGMIGSPMQATFRLRPGDGQGPDAYLDRQPYFQDMPKFLVHETGVHWIDTFRFMFGDALAVYADLRRINPAIAGEDAGAILFDHANGVRVLLDGNRCLDHAAENTRCTMGEGLFEGSDGTLNLLGDGSVWLRKFGSRDQKQILAPDESGTFGGDCTHLLQAHVIEALRGQREFENQAEDYLTVITVENAVYKSAQERAKIDLAPQ